MSQSTTRRLLRLSYLIFAAGCASATTLTLTLNNFSYIPSSVKSKSCQNAYNTPLSDCDYDDFTDNNVCSKKCRASITEVQGIVQEGCADVTIDDSNSLLYRAINGQLVSVLCVSDNSSDDDETTSTTAVASGTHQGHVVSTSIITKTQTTMAAQTTSLVLAGEEPSDVMASAVSSSSAEATETSSSSGSGRGGDPFANNTGAGASLTVRCTTLVVSALMCIAAVM